MNLFIITVFPQEQLHAGITEVDLNLCQIIPEPKFWIIRKQREINSIVKIDLLGLFLQCSLTIKAG